MRIMYLIVRGIFIIVSCAGGFAISGMLKRERITLPWPQAILYGAIISGIVIIIDVLYKKKSVATISAIVFGLVVGIIASYLFVMVLALAPIAADPIEKETYLRAINLFLSVIFSYLAISFILQTRNDFRFIIPYVEFAPERRGPKPMILDTSVIIDGRIADICETKIIDNQVVIPRFVLSELQHIADSAEKIRRNRGRRGLDMLNRLQKSDKVKIQMLDLTTADEESEEEVDSRLIKLAKNLDGRLVTNDFNLNKIAQLQGVEVVNINELANAMRPVVLPGEELPIKIIKPGEEIGQGVGYLDDGTMVVVEQGKSRIGHDVRIIVTSVLQTSAGKMIFGRMPDEQRSRA